jgi:hypothetical protein
MTSTPKNEETEPRLSAPTKVYEAANRHGNNPDGSSMAMQIFDEGREPSATNTPASPRTQPSASTNAPREGGNDETDEERARREEEESIELARALMAEEAMAVSYHMSIDYLRHNRDQFSEEDLAALQAAMEDDEDEGQAVEEEEEDGMSYELMLRLGERMGDVKSERWARVAREKIAALPTFQFDEKTVKGKDENDCEVKCLVCQFPYETAECLRRLPCGHCFHTDCVDQWLMSKDCCPYCRTAIVEEE